MRGVRGIIRRHLAALGIAAAVLGTVAALAPSTAFADSACPTEPPAQPLVACIPLGTDAPILDSARTADGAMLVVVAPDDADTNTWLIDTGSNEVVMSYRLDGTPYAVDVDDAGRAFVFTAEGFVHVVDVNAPLASARYDLDPAPDSAILDLAVSPDGSRLAYTDGFTLSVADVDLDVSTWTVEQSPEIATEYPAQLELHSTGEGLRGTVAVIDMSGSEWAGQLRTFDPDAVSSGFLSTHPLPDAGIAPFIASALTRDDAAGRALYAGAGGVVWALPDGTPDGTPATVLTEDAGGPEPLAIALTGDGSRLLTAGCSCDAFWITALGSPPTGEELPTGLDDVEPASVVHHPTRPFAYFSGNDTDTAAAFVWVVMTGAMPGTLSLHGADGGVPPLQANQGDTIELRVFGADAAGNPLDVTGDTVFSSSVATDVVSGNRIGFPTASPHVITATYGPSGATASITVEVKAMLPPTGADSAATAALAALALAAGLALLAGAARFRRRTR